MFVRTSADYLAAKIHVAIVEILKQQPFSLRVETARDAIAAGSQAALHDLIQAKLGSAEPETDQAGSAK